MDEAYIVKSSKRDALDILEQLGGWPVILGDRWTDNIFTWYKLTERASILGFSSSRILTEGMTFTFACNNFHQHRFTLLPFGFKIELHCTAIFFKLLCARCILLYIMSCLLFGNAFLWRSSSQLLALIRDWDLTGRRASNFATCQLNYANPHSTPKHPTNGFHSTKSSN